jgi:predicted DsbA family dithiol-disulfide isomerase
MQVEIWSDVVCPWCYLGKRRFERALSSFEHRAAVQVVYRSFELDPTAPVGETTATVEHLASRYGLSRTQAVEAQRQMEVRAAADGLSFDMSDLRSGNTRDAHRLIHFAREQSVQAELVERLHAAYFTQRRSIFDRESLVAIAAEAGLDAAEARAVLDSDRYDHAVERDEAEARALGATGVPFFVIDRRYGISGAQPAEVLGRALTEAWDAAVALQRAGAVG